MNKCTVADLRQMTFDKHIKPYKFHANGCETPVEDWSHLCLVFVKWLIGSGHLTSNRLPVPNHARRGKYFINSKPQHKIQEKDGYWQKVGEYHIDTKYNAECHIKNLITTLSHLGVLNPQFQISFYAD